MGNTNSEPIDPDTKGYHVLKVRENSPAAKAQLDAYFDFIVKINEIPLDTDPSVFPAIIKQNVKNPVIFTVFSSKTNSYRSVTLTPDWWAEEKDGLIGCSIRYCDYNGAAMHVWHIVGITPSSPAEMAGLHVDTDYIVGTNDGILREQQDLYSLIAQKCNERKVVKLFVYSTVTKSVREVILLPNREWGGGEKGMIGAELGYGALHRIPVDTDLVSAALEGDKQEPLTSDPPLTKPTDETSVLLANSLPIPDIPMPSAANKSSKEYPKIAEAPLSDSPSNLPPSLSPHLVPLPPSRVPTPLPSS